MENAVGRLYVEAAFAGESKHVVMSSASRTAEPICIDGSNSGPWFG